MRGKQRGLLIAGAVAVGLMGWWWSQRVPDVSADIDVVSEGVLRVTIDEMGTTRVRAHADVNAPVGGRWVPAALSAGDRVQAGHRLGVLYPAPLDQAAREQAQARLGSADAAVREMESRLGTARTTLDEARRQQGRTDALGAVGGIAPQEVERARDLVTTRRLEVQAAEERLRAMRYDRQQVAAALAGTAGRGSGVVVTAPLAGAVLVVAEAHERVVPAGTRLWEIGDPSDLEVVVPLLTADAVRIREGALAQLTFGEGDRSAERKSDTVSGRVIRVEPAAFTRLSALGVEEQRVNVIVSVPATAVHLGDRFRADVRITVWEASRVLRVPTAALVRDGDAWSVWRVRKGRAGRVAVQLGERGPEQAQVIGGLSAGDTVVLFPGDRVTPGARIKAP